jgi:hypothetical protein
MPAPAMPRAETRRESTHVARRFSRRHLFHFLIFFFRADIFRPAADAFAVYSLAGFRRHQFSPQAYSRHSHCQTPTIFFRRFRHFQPPLMPPADFYAAISASN